MAARKGGLGRGLDALIPAKKPAEQTPAEIKPKSDEKKSETKTSEKKDSLSEKRLYQNLMIKKKNPSVKEPCASRRWNRIGLSPGKSLMRMH